MKKNMLDVKNQVFQMLLKALIHFVVGQTTKIDKNGREFISFSFAENTMGVKSLVVYTTQKGDLRILANVTMSQPGHKFNRSFCYLLKNINQEDFFLICGKERLGTRNKQAVLDIITQKYVSSESIYNEVMNEEDNKPY